MAYLRRNIVLDAGEILENHKRDLCGAPRTHVYISASGLTLGSSRRPSRIRPTCSVAFGESLQ